MFTCSLRCHCVHLADRVIMTKLLDFEGYVFWAILSADVMNSECSLYKMLRREVVI